MTRSTVVHLQSYRNLVDYCFSKSKVFYTWPIWFRVVGSWCLSPAGFEQEARYFKTIIQTITHKDKPKCMHTFTPSVKLEMPIKPPCMFLDCGASRENSHIHREYIETSHRKPQPSFKPKSFLLQGDSVNQLHHHAVLPFSGLVFFFF